MKTSMPRNTRKPADLLKIEGKTRRRLQAKVRQLERSNRTKDALLNLLSYELRTPLNVVMGYTGLIRDGMLGKITAAQEKALLKVIGRVKEQLAMINNILYATPRGEKSVKVERSAANLKEFFNELRLANELPLEKPISLVWNGPQEDILLTMDIGKVRLILQNLIDNAVKFTEKGSVTISASMKQQAEPKRQREEGLLTPHSSRLTSSFVEFKVTDTGIGISKEAVSGIFEKLKQIDSSESRFYSGVGMGLYVVKSFTELLGGTVEVESEPGEGSTFTVMIPCKRQ